MSAPRLQITSLFVTLFADRIRLSAYEDLGRFFVDLGLDPEVAGQHGSPVTIDLPKKDRAAYQRAVAAFNAVMDAHDVAEAPKLAKRRTTAAARKTSEVAGR